MLNTAGLLQFLKSKDALLGHSNVAFYIPLREQPTPFALRQIDKKCRFRHFFLFGEAWNKTNVIGSFLHANGTYALLYPDYKCISALFVIYPLGCAVKS